MGIFLLTVIASSHRGSEDLLAGLQVQLRGPMSLRSPSPEPSLPRLLRREAPAALGSCSWDGHSLHFLSTSRLPDTENGHGRAPAVPSCTGAQPQRLSCADTFQPFHWPRLLWAAEALTWPRCRGFTREQDSQALQDICPSIRSSTPSLTARCVDWPPDHPWIASDFTSLDGLWAGLLYTSGEVWLSGCVL